MENKQIELGDKVKCVYSGYTGIAVCKTEFINGCIQYGVVAKWDGKTTEPSETGIDEGSLVIVKKAKKDEDDFETGGPMNKAVRQRGY